VTGVQKIFQNLKKYFEISVDILKIKIIIKYTNDNFNESLSLVDKEYSDKEYVIKKIKTY
jgi:hypothetical protein